MDEQVSAADVTLKCVYSYLFMSVHLVIELLRLVVNRVGGGGGLPACSTTSYQQRLDQLLIKAGLVAKNI